MLSLGTVPRRCGRWLVERGYNNCTVPGLSIYPVRDILSHKTQSKKRRNVLGAHTRGVTLSILHVWLPKLAVFRGRPSRIDRQKV
jgi:hypothetical protein